MEPKKKKTASNVLVKNNIVLHTPKKVEEKLLFHLIRQTFKKRNKTCIMHSKNNYNYASKGSSTKVMYSSVVSCLVLYLI